ncbi:hypothetical protein [Methylobacterium pseudosasicola]|nr:hypothetical protein [Methylobacterium pseudosasicola]
MEGRRGVEGQELERCTMTRTTDDGVDVQFTRDVAGLDLTMSSQT